AWGGIEEQMAEQSQGVRRAKNWRAEAERIIKETMNDATPPPPSSSPMSTPPPLRRPNLDTSDSEDDIEDAYDRTRRALMESADEEVEDWSMEYARYLKDLARDVDRETDLVDWWSKNATKYPTLARIALDVLPVQASSVACERLFSAGKHITTATRSRLNPDVFEQLQLLKAAWRKDLVDISLENELYEEEIK
ncbi:hATC-domain-containing protein, partial [Sistotremastrum suecicum HHB10207 ss-3]